MLRTTHIDLAGFPKDLLWQSSTPERAQALADELSIDEAAVRAWLEHAEAAPHPVGERLAIARLGQASWDRLSARSRSFIATALWTFGQYGEGPQLDYAPVSIEIVKSLEVELGLLFDAFGAECAEVPPHDAKNEAQVALAEAISARRRLGLGAMAFLLRPPTSPSPLTGCLHDFINRMPNAAFLTSDEFLKHSMNRVLHKYRNGGAHDSAISLATCHKCIGELIGTPESPGLIARVLDWTGLPK